jgi:hypothetical protein
MNDTVDYDDEVAEQPARRRNWKPIIAAALAAAVVAAGVALLVTSDPTRTVSGTPVASTVEVTRYDHEVRAQALAAQKEADEARTLSLETQVKNNMQEFFDNPANNYPLRITVSEVQLVKESDGKYEGIATMQMAGYSVHQVLVHVSADGRNVLWRIDPGALLPLFR